MLFISQNNIDSKEKEREIEIEMMTYVSKKVGGVAHYHTDNGSYSPS